MSTTETDALWLKRFQTARTSGLSDYAWCKLHNIPVSTFYYNLKRLKKKVQAGLVPVMTMTGTAPDPIPEQDVVRLDFSPGQDLAQVREVVRPMCPDVPADSREPAARIRSGGISVA